MFIWCYFRTDDNTCDFLINNWVHAAIFYIGSIVHWYWQRKYTLMTSCKFMGLGMNCVYNYIFSYIHHWMYFSTWLQHLNTTLQWNSGYLELYKNEHMVMGIQIKDQSSFYIFKNSKLKFSKCIYFLAGHRWVVLIPHSNCMTEDRVCLFWT